MGRVSHAFYRKLLVALSDVLLYLLCFYLAFLIRFGVHPLPENITAFIAMVPYFLMIFLLLAYVYRLYSEYAQLDEVVVAVFLIVSFGLVMNLASTFVLRQFALPRTVFAIAFVLQLVLLWTWRYAVWKFGFLRVQRKALLVGQEGLVEKVLSNIEQNMSSNIEIMGAIKYDTADEARQVWKRYLETGKDKDPEVIILAPVPDVGLAVEIIDYAVSRGAGIWMVPGLYEVFLQNAKLRSAGDLPLLELGGILSNNGNLWGLKRLFDISISALAIILLVPVLLLISIAIKIDSSGPVFYVQERVGLNGRVFRLFKFRTMREDAEKETGPVLAGENDPRVTRVGRILRRTRLDELPQLINVLKGDMSLVGPRPERPVFVELFSQKLPAFAYRHRVPAGVTGLAQVEGNYSTEAASKLVYDLMYAQQESLAKDLVIMLQTLRVLFLKRKAG